MPFFCAVPIGTPVDPKGVRVIPGAGPYYVASYTPGQGVVLKRNPNYRGNRPRRMKRIELTVGISKNEAVQRITAGTGDYAADGIPREDASGLARRFGPGSAAARSHRQSYFLNTPPELDFYVLNTHRGIFRDVRIRRAVNYALDRRALASLGNPYTQVADRPSDQYLPPGMPGYANTRSYPLKPDLAKARQLAGNTRRSALLYTCNLALCSEAAQIVKGNLAAIGIDLQVKAFEPIALYARLRTNGEPFDIS